MRSKVGRNKTHPAGMVMVVLDMTVEMGSQVEHYKLFI